MNYVFQSEALRAISQLPDGVVDLIYIDPPFGTNADQVMERKKDGEVVSTMSYSDRQEDYLAFLRPHLIECKRLLKETGSLYLHLDYRWVHYAKVACDEIFGRSNFINEVIWAYDFGGRGKRCWPKKHDNILVYSREPGKHVFNWDAIDRIPYMAPGLQKDDARAEAGKVPTDVWWMTIVGTSAKERTGYPNQKPVKLIERAVLASSPPGGLVLDFFAGSGTTGEAAHRQGRNFILVDSNPASIEVMQHRFQGIDVKWHV